MKKTKKIKHGPKAALPPDPGSGPAPAAQGGPQQSGEIKLIGDLVTVLKTIEADKESLRRDLVARDIAALGYLTQTVKSAQAGGCKDLGEFASTELLRRGLIVFAYTYEDMTTTESPNKCKKKEPKSC